MYLNHNKPLLSAILDGRHILKFSTEFPTPCKELVTVWPQCISVKDALLHGVGGIIVVEDKYCVYTVFRFAWTEYIQELYCK